MWDGFAALVSRAKNFTWKTRTRNANATQTQSNAKDSMDDDSASALRVVLGVAQLEEIRELREELKTVKAELDDWKGGREKPTPGAYYNASDELLEMHGWEFGEIVPLRYDGRIWKEWKTLYGMKCSGSFHLFTTAYEDREGKWIRFELSTPELHQTWPHEWNPKNGPMIYLDADGNAQTFPENSSDGEDE